MTYVKILFLWLISFAISAQTIDQYKTTTAGGSVNAYTIPNSDFGAYRTNEKWLIDFTGVTTNSGAATLNRFNLGPVSIKMPDGTDPTSGILKGRVQLSYNGTYFYIVGGAGSGGVTWGSITGTLSSQTDLQSALDAKQATLVSGTNIRTVNGSTLLGSTNLAVGDALVANPLSQFASTTSSQLAGVISNETGSGALVFATSPSLVTPALGVPASGDFSTGSFTWPTFNQNTTGSSGSITNALTVDNSSLQLNSGTTFNGSAAKTISVKNGGITNAMLANSYESPLTFSTGLTRSTNTITVNTSQNISTLSNLTSNGLIKTSGGTGALSIATSGTDYAPATSGTSILYGNGSGGFSNVTVGSGLSFSTGTLSATGGGGTVTTVSVVSANGFAGSVSNASTTPAITLTTSITGMLKGNGTAISAATAGTDYISPTNIGYSTTSLNVNLLGQTGKNLQLGADGNVWETITTNGLRTLSSANVDSSTPTMFRLSPGAYTQITASTENPDIVFDLARDVQWATGNFTTQKFLQITAPTMSAIGASTVSKASTVSIAGAPVAGSNMTLTTIRSLWSLAGVIDAEDNTTNNDRNFTASRNVFDANAPYFTFEKSKGAVGSPATVANGDFVGAIRTKLYDGTQYTYRTPIQFQINAAVASTFTGTDIIFQTNPSAGVESEIARFRYNGDIVLGGTTGKERFKTTNAGGFVFATVLIDPATSETSGKSYGFDTNNGLAFLQGNGTSRIMFAKIIGSDLTTTANSEAGGLSFYTQSAGAAATEKFRIKPLGQFGLNTTTPTGGFEFVGVNLSSSTSGWLTTGMQAAWGGATYTDPQTGSPTRATAVSFSIARSTYTNTGSSNTVATDGSTLYIENAPATSNTSTGSYTITRPWSLWIDAGNARFDGNLDFSQADATNIVLGTGTGTKLGTSTSQKLAFYNSTPIVQPSGDVGTALSNLGLVATPTFDSSTKFSTNTTGSGTALLGANSPAVTNTAPYTWIQVKSSDGSTVYIPAWK